jgi:hypothetical protein
MMTLRQVLSSLVCISIASCASSKVVTHESRRLLGKEVLVEGYLDFGDDAHGLWTSRRVYIEARDGSAGPDDLIWRNCINLNASSDLRSRLTALNGRTVLLSGLVIIKPHGIDDVFAYSCNDVALSVGKVVKAR